MTVIQQTIYIMFVFYISICVMLLLPFYLLKCRTRNIALAFVTISLAEFMASGMIRYFIVDALWLRFLTNMTIYGIVVFLMFEDRARRKAAVLITEAVLLLLEEVITYILLDRLNFPGGLDLEKYDAAIHQGTIIANMVSYMLNMYFIVFWKVFIERKRRRSYFLYLIIPFYQMVLLIVFLSQARQFTWKIAMYGMALLAMGILVCLVISYLFASLEQKADIEEELTVLYRQRQNELNYYRLTEQYIEQMREIRHDFVNQIQTAHLLIQDGKDTERAKQLLSESYNRLRDVKLIRYCENPVVNALISAKEQKAVAGGIRFTTNCRTEGLNYMEEIDVCSLFGNLLDNAIEACGKITSGKEKCVELNAWTKGNYQIVQVINTYEENQGKNDFFKTDKSDTLNHGYGMKLIEKICQKYRGELKKQIEGGRVTVTAYLNVIK